MRDATRRDHFSRCAQRDKDNKVKVNTEQHQFAASHPNIAHRRQFHAPTGKSTTYSCSSWRSVLNWGTLEWLCVKRKRRSKGQRRSGRRRAQKEEEKERRKKEKEEKGTSRPDRSNSLLRIDNQDGRKWVESRKKKREGREGEEGKGEKKMCSHLSMRIGWHWRIWRGAG